MFAGLKAIEYGQAGRTVKEMDYLMPDQMVRHAHNLIGMHSRHSKPAKGSTPLCIFVVGENGVGKTQLVLRKFGRERVFRYTSTDGTFRFTGLRPEQHTVLLLDEFNGQVPSTKLNEWCQEGPIDCRMFSAANVYWQPEVVVIVSNYFPPEWTHYDWKQNPLSRRGLYRRLHIYSGWVTHTLIKEKYGGSVVAWQDDFWKHVYIQTNVLNLDLAQASDGSELEEKMQEDMVKRSVIMGGV